jgi:hypothetical protein
LSESFAGWMLLNYNKPVQVSTLWRISAPPQWTKIHKTYWSAKTGSKKKNGFKTDFGRNFNRYCDPNHHADQDVELMETRKFPLWASVYFGNGPNDGRNW